MDGRTSGLWTVFLVLNYWVYWVKGVVLYLKNCVGCYCMLVIEFVIILGLFIDVKYFHRFLQLLLINKCNSIYYCSDINMRRSVTFRMDFILM
jgi:hypothetical protein